MIKLKYQPNQDLYELGKELGVRSISYSQLSLFWNCPLSWKIKYVDKIDLFKESIHLVFGTALHETIQTWLDVRFNEDNRKLNLQEMLSDNMRKCFLEAMNKNNSSDFTDEEAMVEIYSDGVQILKYLEKNVDEYFPTENYKLLGCEIPIFHQIQEGIKVYLLGYIDVAIYNSKEDKYIFRDIKTSKSGWNPYEMKDFSKNSQLLIYKKYFSKMYNVSMDKIDVEFFIVKKKLLEDSRFPQKRVQLHSPTSGPIKIKELDGRVNEFLSVFNNEGEVKNNVSFNKTDNDNHCRFCIYKGSKYCNKYPIDKENELNKI